MVGFPISLDMFPARLHRLKPWRSGYYFRRLEEGRKTHAERRWKLRTVASGPKEFLQ